ncbi:MAG: hypothetical protein ACFB51_13190, partial [Anaerolineae bacterium]
MGLLGGTIISVEALTENNVLGVLPFFTKTYWGVDALTTLAAGESGILLNVVLLVALGAVMFAVGLWAFNTREDVAS